MNKKALFIGGCMDGKMEFHDGERRVRRAVDAEFTPGPEYRTVEVDLYRLEMLCGENVVRDLYILDTLTVGDAINLLVDNYKQQ